MKKYFSFSITKKEMKECDFVIIYFHGDDNYFIIPNNKIPENGIIALYRRDEGTVGEDTKYKEYENNWQILD